MKGENLVGVEKSHSMESVLYGIYVLVVFVSENSLVRYAHSFVF